MNRLIRTDFHTHILPRMDDGAEDVEESLELLGMLKKDGVDVVVATPHLYLHRKSLEEFLIKRERCAEELAKATAGGDYPQIILGAEVYFTTALNELPLKELCITGTNSIMIELPYSNFSRMFMNSFYDFVSGCEYNIILAHIERYYDFTEEEKIREILDYGVMAQINCDSIAGMRRRKQVFDLIKSNQAQLLGTDLHSVRERPPSFGKAERILRKRLSDRVFEELMMNAENLLFKSHA